MKKFRIHGNCPGNARCIHWNGIARRPGIKRSPEPRGDRHLHPRTGSGEPVTETDQSVGMDSGIPHYFSFRCGGQWQAVRYVLHRRSTIRRPGLVMLRQGSVP